MIRTYKCYINNFVDEVIEFPYEDKNNEHKILSNGKTIACQYSIQQQSFRDTVKEDEAKDFFISNLKDVDFNKFSLETLFGIYTLIGYELNGGNSNV